MLFKNGQKQEPPRQAEEQNRRIGNTQVLLCGEEEDGSDSSQSQTHRHGVERATTGPLFTGHSSLARDDLVVGQRRRLAVGLGVALLDAGFRRRHRVVVVGWVGPFAGRDLALAVRNSNVTRVVGDAVLAQGQGIVRAILQRVLGNPGEGVLRAIDFGGDRVHGVQVGGFAPEQGDFEVLHSQDSCVKHQGRKDRETYSTGSARPLHGSRLARVKLSRPVSEHRPLGSNTRREQAGPDGQSSSDEVHVECETGCSGCGGWDEKSVTVQSVRSSLVQQVASGRCS